MIINISNIIIDILTLPFLNLKQLIMFIMYIQLQSINVIQHYSCHSYYYMIIVTVMIMSILTFINDSIWIIMTY